MPEYELLQTTHVGCVAAGMDIARSGSAQPPFEHQFRFSEFDRTQHHPCVQLAFLE